MPSINPDYGLISPIARDYRATGQILEPAHHPGRWREHPTGPTPEQAAVNAGIRHHAHMPTIPAQELEHIASATLAYYNEQAEAFWQGTRHHDVSQNIDTLLRHLPGGAGHAILDLGCGPGRDLKTFRDLGHQVIGLEGAARFAAMARTYSGCEVWEQNLLALDLPAERFDGVYANAVLFHVPSAQLGRVLAMLHATLKPGGVLMSSNPHGQGQEGWQAGRYGAFHDLQAWRAYMSTAGFTELEHFYRPTGLPRHQQPWLASAWRKPGATAAAAPEHAP
jgi:SAM-dependent methyltransferase